MKTFMSYLPLILLLCSIGYLVNLLLPEAPPCLEYSTRIQPVLIGKVFVPMPMAYCAKYGEIK